ncbi:hypothetical protein HispidOSU_000575, partial [Sigmodon hispidus]
FKDESELTFREPDVRHQECHWVSSSASQKKQIRMDLRKKEEKKCEGQKELVRAGTRTQSMEVVSDRLFSA